MSETDSPRIAGTIDRDDLRTIGRQRGIDNSKVPTEVSPTISPSSRLDIVSPRRCRAQQANSASRRSHRQQPCGGPRLPPMSGRPGRLSSMSAITWSSDCQRRLQPKHQNCRLHLRVSLSPRMMNDAQAPGLSPGHLEKAVRERPRYHRWRETRLALHHAVEPAQRRVLLLQASSGQ